MAINQVTTSNTFNQWLSATQSLISTMNAFTDQTSAATPFVVNTKLQISGTGSFIDVKTNASINVVSTNTIIFADGSRVTTATGFGYTGSQGFTGSKGFTGSQGFTGSAGTNGSQGVIGFTGSSGSQGSIGFTGSSGSSGTNGFTGSLGTIGFTGSGYATTANVQMFSLGVGTAPSQIEGEIRAANNVTAYYSSDRRLKENIQNIQNPIQMVQRLNGVRFDWTDDYISRHGGEDGIFVRKRDVGVIAQELVEVLPELVVERGDGYLAVKYDRIVALLLEAIKELDERVKNLEGK